jgi:hypothetical protein
VGYLRKKPTRTYRFLKNISFSGIVNTMKIDLSIYMSCKAGFLLTISLFGQQEVMLLEALEGEKKWKHGTTQL